MVRRFLYFPLTFILFFGACLFAAEPLTIVTFGDSVTATRGRTEIYSNLLARELSYETQDVKVINAGVGGHHTKMAKARFGKDVLENNPDVVVIMFGINDAAVDVWKNPPADQSRISLTEYKKNLT